MPADVLAHDLELAVCRGPCRGVHGVRFEIQRLTFRKLGRRAPERRVVDAERLRQAVGEPHGVLDRLDAAQPAAGARHERARSVLEPRRVLFSNLNLQLDSM